ncbi:MAG TPA: hypothetical protein PKY05_14580 [Fibrobacteria bacterium]|nr:hypothetical protein [Fibrobacteria bacterium]
MNDLATRDPAGSANQEMEGLKQQLHSMVTISDKALKEVARLRSHRHVLSLCLGSHRRHIRICERDLKAFAQEIHSLYEDVRTRQTALLEVAKQRDDLRLELASERANVASLVASLQADLEGARSAAFEADAKWRIALEAEHLAHQRSTPKPWNERLSSAMERVASRILFGKGNSRTLEALDG